MSSTGFVGGLIYQQPDRRAAATVLMLGGLLFLPRRRRPETDQRLAGDRGRGGLAGDLGQPHRAAANV